MLRPGDRIGPFDLDARLGGGSAGSVFKARVREDVPALSLRRGDEVAVKVVAVGAAGADPALDDARREAETGAGLSHAHLAAIHGVLVAALPRGAGRAALLACELAEGVSLAARLAASGPLADPDLRRVASHAAKALAALHARGILHRDVKPANLVEAPDGTVRLVDLGLARRLETASEEGLSGTLSYIAPEQILDSTSADARADLYSLGATLFECATGAPPFAGPDSLALLRRHLLERPPRLRAAGAQVSPEVEGLVAALLEKDPDARPRDAAGVLGILEGRGIARSEVAAASGVAKSSLPLAGRDDLAARLRGSLSAAAPGFLLAIVGERGAGKSRLVREAVVRDHGAHARAGGEDAAGLLSDLLRGLCDRSPGGIGALLSSVPGLVGPARRLLEGKRSPQAALVAAAALRAALGAGRGAPALVVDDAHGLSASETEALRVLLADPGEAAWALVLCAREAEATDAARALLDRADLRVEVGRLSRDDLGTLASAAGVGDGIRSLVADRLWTATGGNAGLASRLLLRMREVGALAAGEERWNVLLDPASTLQGAEEARLVAERVQGLDAEARRVLEAAAILGPRFDPSALVRVLGESPVRLLRRLADLEHHHRLLSTEGGALRFDPELLAAAVLAPLPAQKRRALHASAAAAYPEGSPERVRHLALGGRATEALSGAATAVASLREAGRDDAGLRLADEILLATAAVEDRARRFDLLLERLLCLRGVPGAKGHEETARALEGAAAGLDPRRRAAALEQTAAFLHRSGDAQGAVRLLRSAYALRRSAADVEGKLLNLREQTRALAAREGFVERRERLLRHVVRGARALGNDRLLVDALPAEAQAERVHGRLAGALARLREAAAAAQRLNDPAAEGAVRTARVLTLAMAGRHREALRANRAARGPVRESGRLDREAQLLRLRAQSLVVLGRPGPALRLVEAAAPVARAFGNHVERLNLDLLRAMALVRSGREREALEVNEGVAREAAPLGEPRLSWVAPLLAAKVAARLGERARAAAAIRAVRAHSHGDAEALAGVRSALAIAEARRGRFVRAARLARRASDALVTKGSVWGETRSNHVLAAVLALRAGSPAARLARRAWRAVSSTDEPALRALASAALSAAVAGEDGAALRADRCARRAGRLSAFDAEMLEALAAAARRPVGARL